MKNYYYFLSFFLVLLSINTIKAQQYSTPNSNSLATQPVIANLNYLILPTTINTDKSNIALGTFKEKFIISSYKRQAHAKIDINEHTKEKVPNFMCTDVFFDKNLKYPTLFSHLLKSEYNEGAITFNKEFTIAFITRKKNLNEKAHYLYQTELIDVNNGIWSEPKEILIDNLSIPISNPKLSADNKYLYFAADLAGGFGGFDIYKAEYIDGKSFKNMLNLGPDINTPFNEISAMDEGEFLYFSSNTPGGFGGYDIYRISDKNGIYKYKINVGDKINTQNDEINIVPVTETDGYLTSDKDNKGIFSVYRYSNLHDKVQLKTTFIDPNKKNIQNLAIKITNEDGQILFEGNTNKEGTVIINTKPFDEVNYSFTSSSFYTNKKLYYTIKDDNPTHSNIIELDQYDTEPIVIKPTLSEIEEDNVIYFGFNKFNLNPIYLKNINNIVDVLKQDSNLIINIRAYADSRGTASYNKKLTEKRAETIENLLIEHGISRNRILKEANGSSNFAVKCKICTKEQNALNRRLSFKFETEK